MSDSEADMSIVARELPLSAAPERLKPLLTYWLEKRGSHLMPARADIDPLDLRGMLDWISLVEIRPTEPRFFFRVAGGKISNVVGTQNGADLSVLRSPTYRESVERHWQLVADSGEPRFDEFDLTFRGYRMTYCRYALPLGADRKTTDMILIGSHFDEPRQKLFLDAFDRATRPAG
jgi:hypothetical protein